MPKQCAKTMCQNKNDEYDELYIFEKALDTANLNVYANKKENWKCENSLTRHVCQIMCKISF